MGEMEILEVGQGPIAIGCRGPDDGKRLDELPRSSYLAFVFCVLNQLHDDKAGNRGQLLQVGEPIHGGWVTALDVDQDV